MSVQDDFKTAMVADTGAGGLNTLLTGGIYVWDKIGRQGVTPERTPNAFSGLTVKPHAVIKGRAIQPADMVSEHIAQMSWRQVIEIYIADDAYADSATLEAVHARLKTLFHGSRVATHKTLWINSIVDEREAPLGDAQLFRVDFAVYGVGAS